MFDFSQCQEAVNLGTKEKPLYSCIKCYKPQTLFGTNLIDYILIKDIKTNVSFCIYSINMAIISKNNDLANCEEAIAKKNGGKISFSCTKCSKDYSLVYDKNLEMNYCKPMNNENRCMVQYCKTCKSGNNFECNECILSNYVVNSATGACVEKTEIIPSITWQDIFRLQMNGVEEINGKKIYGPTLILRGTTSSQINSKHAFLIYLTFAIKQTGRIRYLQENIKKMPAYCVIEKPVEEKDDDVNLVDYKCIGDNTEGGNLEEYELNNIEEGNNTNSLINSNLFDIVGKTDLKNLVNKINSNFTLEDFEKIITFKMDEIKNFTSDDNYNFDFKLDGTINKDINPVTIKGKLEICEIENLAADCNFVVEQNKIANLNCYLNVEQYKNQKYFTFKTFEISDDNNRINLAKIDQVNLINRDEDEDKDKDEKKKDNKTVIIVVSMVCSVIVLGVAAGIIIYYIKKKKLKNKDEETEKHGIKDNNIKTIQLEENPETSKNKMNNKD